MSGTVGPPGKDRGKGGLWGQKGQGWMKRNEAAEVRQRGLTRSTMFLLLVSARGPDTKASHCSCCSPGSSAQREGTRM